MRNPTDNQDNLFDDFQIEGDSAPAPTANMPKPIVSISTTALIGSTRPTEPVLVEIEIETETDEIPPLSNDDVLQLLDALQSDDAAESEAAERDIIAALKANRILLFSQDLADTYTKAYRNNRDVYVPTLKTLSEAFDGLKNLDIELDTIQRFYKKHEEKIKNLDGLMGVATWAPTLVFDNLAKKAYSAAVRCTREGFDKQRLLMHQWDDFIEVFDEEGIEIDHFLKLMHLFGAFQGVANDPDDLQNAKRI